MANLLCSTAIFPIFNRGLKKSKSKESSAPKFTALFFAQAICPSKLEPDSELHHAIRIAANNSQPLPSRTANPLGEVMPFSFIFRKP
jgi:hypothetical protein